MKRFLFALALVLPVCNMSAQFYYQDSYNKEMLRHGIHSKFVRHEFVLPVQVNGLNIYKADLHTHSVYSDGNVTPKFRIQEAWRDGLDVLAVTEHIEYRPFEKEMKKYLSVESDVTTDLNAAVREAEKEAAKWDIVVIPGTEITRDGEKVGHFNGLFTTDNNLIYDEDPVEAIRNAKKQGALVMHNHPGWLRKDIDYTEVEKKAYKEGLIDGVEVMNGAEFYPGIIDRVREKGLFIAANTDIHASTDQDYGDSGCPRPMTLIFAGDRSLDSLKTALDECRTLALGFNTVCGDEQLLKDFFAASVSLKFVRDDSRGRPHLMLTNNTSVPYLLAQEGKNPVHLPPLSTISIRTEKGQKALIFAVLNMFCSESQHPVIELAF